MDIAGGVLCKKFAKGKMIAINIDSTTFNAPIFVGNTLYSYVSLVKTRRISQILKSSLSNWRSIQQPKRYEQVYYRYDYKVFMKKGNYSQSNFTKYYSQNN